MKQITWPSISVLILSLATGATWATGHGTCKPVIGHFQASVVLPGAGHCPGVEGTFCTAGRVWGGIQGSYEFVMTGTRPAVEIGGLPTVLFFVGDSAISLKRGDLLFGEDTGSIDLPPGQGGFASLITFNGGTGKMSGAGGQIRLRGEFEVAEGTTAGDYIGILCAG